MSKKAIPDFGTEPGPPLHTARWRFGVFALDETRRELTCNDELLGIEPKPLNLLMLMLRRPGELITKQELVDALWVGRPVGDAVVAGTVARLRTALGAEAGDWIRTVHGFGYRFDAPSIEIVGGAASDPVEAPKLALEAGVPPPLRPNWRLLRRLGQSGDTWLAEHAKMPSRRVFKFTAEPRGLSALKREVTVYRLLQQSVGERRCYVELHDWNFDEPPYFIEAEYCDGGSLLEWFDAHGGAAKVSLDTRIELVARIAEALGEVHLVGVLHKDLKPANIFVVPDGSAVPAIRLGDFGASRLIDHDRLARLQITRLGFTQVIDPADDAQFGTLLYLAPEVIDGQPATVKADLYALGVMLYQLVIGNLRRPLGAGWEIEIVDPMLREDIALAAEANPERRLADAGELARRLRSLDARRRAHDDALEAGRRAEAAARAADRARARRVGIIVAFAAMAAGVVVSLVLYVQAREARRVAEYQTRIAEAEARRATAVSQFLARDLFEPVTSGKVPVKDMTIEQLLDAGSRKIATRFGDQPDVAADLHASLGQSYYALELSEPAERELEHALTMHRSAFGDGDIRTVADAAELATLKFAMGRDDRFIETYESIAIAARERLGATHPQIADLRVQLAWVRFYRGAPQPAAATMQSLLDDFLRHRPDDDERIADLCFGLGHVLSELGDYARAERLLREAIVRATRQRGEDHGSIGFIHASLGRVAWESGRLDDADREYGHAIRIARRWTKESSGQLTGALTGLGRVRIQQGRLDEAIALLSALIEDRSGDLLPEVDQLAMTRAALGEALFRHGDAMAAQVLFDEAIASSIRTYGKAHMLTSRIRLRIAELHAERGAFAAARSVLAQPVPLAFPEFPPTHPAVTALTTLKARLGRDTEPVNSQAGNDAPRLESAAASRKRPR